MSKIIEFADLHCTEGGSDKAYHCAIQEVEPGLYHVPFAYGRVGSTLTTGCKTSAPVPLDKAQKVYEKLVREKTGKGYLAAPGISGNIFGVGLSTMTPQPATAMSKADSNHRPQLLNPINEEDVAAYISSPIWGMQEKMDGERKAIRSTVANGIEGINRKGQIVPLHPELANSVDKTNRCGLVDGESIGSTLYAFDLLDQDSTDLRHLRYIDRYNKLLLFCDDMENIEAVPLAITTAEKQALFNRVKLSGGEGVVFKRLDAPYEPGRPSTGGPQVKFKFWESATCIVTGVNEGKRSVQIAASDADGTAEIPVGNVTIPANHSIPAVGSLVEIKYLYFFPGGSLYQPQYLGVRSDVDRGDCDITKLKVVQETRKAA